MSNIGSYKDYIQDAIINRLERLMGNNEVDDQQKIKQTNLWRTTK